MKYTAGELRKMNGRKCKIKYACKPEAEGEIYVQSGEVYFISNNQKYSSMITTVKTYEYCRRLAYGDTDDDFIDTNYHSITLINENIYYDDNGEEIREGDWVLVGDELTDKRIFLSKVSQSNFPYIVVNHRDEKKYWEGNIVGWDIYQKCIKCKEQEKKLRELMLTDEEYEEVKNKYK